MNKWLMSELINQLIIKQALWTRNGEDDGEQWI